MLMQSLGMKFENIMCIPREEEFALQIEKVDALIAHLEQELEE